MEMYLLKPINSPDKKSVESLVDFLERRGFNIVSNNGLEFIVMSERDVDNTTRDEVIQKIESNNYSLEEINFYPQSNSFEG